ncbi:MAG: PAS domain S-box protein [Candidatus Methanoperedens sp.]|nr:PAS domain S-box protein [Candidatus Methanoperedens sp.]
MKFKLQDLIDMKLFQKLQERLNEIYSFPSAIIDNEGNILTATGWQDICRQFHRKNKECERHCIQSDQYILSHLHEANPTVSYRCPHGLVDNATPIIIDGIHYGNFFTGQFFLEKPDMEFFRSQAKKYGFDEDAYLEAVKKVPIWTQEQLNSYIFFMKGLIAIISESGLKKIKEIETRKQIEESQERHRIILQTAMDGFWMTDMQGHLLEVNEAYCRMSGYSEQELLTMSISDLEAVETNIITADHIHKVKAQGEERFESLHRRKDGSIFDVEVSVQYHPKDDGWIVAYLRDITDRKRAEERMRQSEEMFSNLFSEMVSGCSIQELICNTEGEPIDYITLDVNKSFERILNLSKEDVVGKPASTFLPSEELSKWVKIFGKVAIDGHSRPYEQFSPTNNKYFAGVVFSPKCGQFAVTFEDITERKLAEEKLRESEERFRCLVEFSPYGISIHSDGIIVFANQEGAKMLRVKDPEALIGKPVIDFVHPDYHEIVMKRIKLQKEGITASSLEEKLVRIDGTIVDVELMSIPIIYKGKQAFYNVFHDITDRKRAEEEIRRRDFEFNESQRVAHIGSWDWNSITDIITWSPEYYRIYNIDPKLPTPNYLEHLKIYTSESAKRLEEAVFKTMQTGEPYELELELVNPGENRRWIFVMGEAKRDTKGQIVGLRGIAQNITRRKQSEERLSKLNGCFLNFSPEPLENINRLTALCGELMGATCALYNRLDQGMLCSLGQWNTPQDYNSVDKPEGHICYDVITRGSEEMLVIHNLPETLYARTDPNVRAYNLKTYIGKAVKFCDDYVGSLCVVYQNDFSPGEDDKWLMGVIASAIATEEKRRHVEETLREREAKLSAMIEGFDGLMYICSKDYRVEFMNSQLIKRTGYNGVGDYCYKVLHERDSICPWCVNDRIFRGETVRWEVQSPKDNRWYYIVNTPIYHEDRSISKQAMITDITERKLAEKALHESEEKYRALMNEAGDAIILADMNGNVLEVNKKMEELLGYTKEELSNMNIAKIHPEEELERTIAAFKVSANLNDGQVLRKDGKIVPVDITGSAIEYAGRKAILGIFRDITERKKAEEAISISEKKYRMLIDNMQDGIFIIQDGKLQFVNESFAILAGYSVEEVLHRDFLDFIAPEDKGRVIDNYSRRLAGENVPKEYELNLLHKDGARIIANVNVGLIAYRGRTASMGTMKDITKHKRAEEALRESEEKYRALMNYSGDAIILIDIEGNIVEVNKKAEELTGYTKNELLTMKIFQLHPKEEIERIIVLFKAGMQKGSATLNDLPVLRKDGRIVPVDLTGNNVVFAGKLVGQATIRDITERKHAEEQIKASLKEKEILLKEIHHRVKNNMQVISSLLGLASINIKDEKYVEIFRDSQNRINSMALIHENLYRSKDLAKIDLNKYIRELANSLFQYSKVAGRIELFLDIENVSLGIDLAIPCGLIINELITNSLKHAFPGDRNGEIKVSAHLNDENIVELIFSDNGVGIPSDIDFRNTHSLGLHLITMLAEAQLHGKIDLDRSIGTEFKISFKGMK